MIPFKSIKPRFSACSIVFLNKSLYLYDCNLNFIKLWQVERI